MTLPATLVIAGTHSGVGKTTVATAIVAALARRGLRVAPFKVGPDFIDPGFHAAAAGRPSRNLDGWMLSRAANLEIFARAAAGADVALVEGVMGLFDGRDAASESGSTSEMAKWLGAPVVLVVDGSALARSAAAVVHGYETFDPALDIAGVVFNRVAGAGHYRLLRDAVEAGCRAKPIGFLAADAEVTLPERHLGLVTAAEVLDAPRLDRLVASIEGTVSIDELVGLARPSRIEEPAALSAPAAPRARIGVARDRAFCFYYQDNLDLLSRSGAELVEFSPISDARLPERLDGLYLGGGYPELHATALAANTAMRAEVDRFARSGRPVYAECGGLMYLTEAIVDVDGAAHPMVGIFPTRARMGERLAAIGYVEVELTEGSGWAPAGARARGHEFRYSTIDPMACEVPRRYRAESHGAKRADGFAAGGVLASYVHLHFHSCPELAARFVAACADHRKEMQCIDRKG